MPNNNACWTEPIDKWSAEDRVRVILHMVRCRRTRAETGIIRTEIGSIRLVILMINYASAERLGWRWRRSWICDTEHNNFNELPMNEMACIQLKDAYKSISMCTYPCPCQYKDAFAKLLWQHLDSGFIQPSNSWFASPSFVIPKADPCYVPYHRSNSVSISTQDVPQTHSWSSTLPVVRSLFPSGQFPSRPESSGTLP